MKIIGIGENICDQYMHNGMMFPGGQTANFVVFCKKQNLVSALLTVFGTDDIAEFMKENFEKMDIDLRHSRTIEGENGYVRVNIVDGERRFVRANRGGVLNDHPIVLNDEDLTYIRQFDFVYTSHIGRINSQLPILKKETTVRIGYDFNSFMWKEEAFVETVAPNIDFAFMAVDPGDEQLAKVVANKMISHGVSYVITTFGERGETIYHDGKEYTHQPVYIEPLDALGAGDAFAAGFISSLLQSTETDEDIMSAMLQGEAMAAQTLSVEGAYGCGMPFDTSRQSADEGDIDPRKYKRK